MNSTDKFEVGIIKFAIGFVLAGILAGVCVIAAHAQTSCPNPHTECVTTCNPYTNQCITRCRTVCGLF